MRACSQWHLALVFLDPWPLPADQLLLIFTDSSITVPDEEAVFLHQVDMSDYSEIDFMVLLHRFGVEKAVIQSTIHCLPGLVEVVFVHSEGTLAAHEVSQRLPKPWPARTHEVLPILPLWTSPDASSLPPCLLDLDLTIDDLHKLFSSAQDVLCTSLEGLDLPEVTMTATQSLTNRSHFDRLVIYMDGSSQSHHKHHSPAFNEEFDVPDAWSFVVLGETFLNENDSDLTLVGWSAHQVRCDPEHPWHIGAQHLSSAVAEREALFWAMLWRIGYNSTIPTIFRSDSMLAIGQASGTLGPTVCDLSFQTLRGSAQLLQRALGSGFALDHVYGHAGDPRTNLLTCSRRGKHAQASTSRDLLSTYHISVANCRSSGCFLMMILASRGSPDMVLMYIHLPYPLLWHPCRRRHRGESLVSSSLALA